MESQLPADNDSIWFSPFVVTNRTPLVVMKNLHSTLVSAASANQSDGWNVMFENLMSTGQGRHTLFVTGILVQVKPPDPLWRIVYESMRMTSLGNGGDFFLKHLGFVPGLPLRRTRTIWYDGDLRINANQTRIKHELIRCSEMQWDATRWRHNAIRSSTVVMENQYDCAMMWWEHDRNL